MQQQTVMSSLGRLASLDVTSPSYVIDVVDLILGEAALCRRERHPPAADRRGPGGPLPDRRRAPAGRHPPQVALAERGRAPQGAREYDHLSDRHPPGGADPRVRRRGRDAGEHVPHLLRREGRHPDVRRNAPVPAAGGPGAARGDPTDLVRAPERDLRRDPVQRARRQRQDHDPLHLPARAGRPPRAGAAA